MKAEGEERNSRLHRCPQMTSQSAMSNIKSSPSQIATSSNEAIAA
jgi:hypothetical protein